MSRRLTNRPSVEILCAGLIGLLILINSSPACALPVQARKSHARRTAAVVIDERLAVLRDKPDLSARLIRRLNRGRIVSITGATNSSPEGVVFYRVTVTRRTRGWLQAESVARPLHPREAERLLRLIRASSQFDRLARARLFLDFFPASSPLRPAVLHLFGEAAEEAAARLSREAGRRLAGVGATAAAAATTGEAPAHSYFMNYRGLDRLNRLGVKYRFNRTARQFHYDGAAWHEILRRHPHSPEAVEARRRLDSISATRAP